MMAKVKYRLDVNGQSIILDNACVTIEHDSYCGKDVLEKLRIIDGNNVMVTLELVRVLDSETGE